VPPAGYEGVRRHLLSAESAAGNFRGGSSRVSTITRIGEEVERDPDLS